MCCYLVLYSNTSLSLTNSRMWIPIHIYQLGKLVLPIYRRAKVTNFATKVNPIGTEYVVKDKKIIVYSK